MRSSFAIYIIGITFSVIGAVMAYTIVYEEYSHHFADRGRTFRMALQAAGFTLAVFLVLTFFISLFF